MYPTSTSATNTSTGNSIPAGNVGSGVGSIRRACLPHSSLTADVKCAIRSLTRPYTNTMGLDVVFAGEVFEQQQDISDEKKVGTVFDYDGESSTRRRRRMEEMDGEMRVTATLYGMGGVPLHGHSVCATTCSSHAASTPSEEGKGSEFDGRNGRKEQLWDDILNLPIRWKDLPRDACIGLNVIGASGVQLWGTSLSIFDKNGLMRNGMMKLQLYEHVVADGCGGRRCGTPGLSYDMPAKMDFGSRGRNSEQCNWWQPNHTSRAIPHTPALHQGYGPADEALDYQWKAALVLERLEDPLEGAPPSRSSGNTNNAACSWLDNLTKDRCRQMLNELSFECDRGGPNDSLSRDISPFPHQHMDNKNCYLIVELPIFSLPVIHEEIFYPHSLHGASGSVTPLDLALYRNRLAALEAAAETNQNATAPVSTASKPTPPPRSLFPLTSLPSGEPPPPASSSMLLSQMADGEQQDMGLSLVEFLDYEDEEENPAEDKYRTLAHDLIRGLVDPALKPDREQRGRLASIIASHSNHLTREEKDLLWRFRFSLVDNRKALTKFLLAVDWMEEGEVIQAAELLEQWRKRSPIEVTDALKLLGRHVAFQTTLVRAYAIDTLASAPDEELRLYLLQLVQAIKYEDVNGGSSDDHHRSRTKNNNPNLGFSQESLVSASSSVGSGSATSVVGGGGRKMYPLANFLIDRASKNVELANDLYWYLKVEMQDATYGERFCVVFAGLKEKLSRTPASGAQSNSSSHPATHGLTSAISTDGTKKPFSSLLGSVSKLGSSFRSASDETTPDHNTFTMTSHSRNAGASKTSSSTTLLQNTMWEILVLQDKFITDIMEVQMESRDVRGKKDAKEAHLRKKLSSRGLSNIGNQNKAVPLPSAPNIMVTGCNPQVSRMFKSALYPALIEFRRTVPPRGGTSSSSSLQNLEVALENYGSEPKEGNKTGNTNSLATAQTTNTTTPDVSPTYKAIVKTGDDLRQDQLVMMMVRLMDGLLKRGTLDLCLRPYSIIATSQTAGLVEFVAGSIPISQILGNHNNSILQYFQQVAPSKSAKYSVQPDVMQTYVRSCAGYCVITYLLGVGDRHLDNIMLLPTGNFFHIDFGFIFGRDPKPLPPPFRLTREMVDGMGGIDSVEYRRFCSLACQAYNILRKNAGLVLNLLHLMSDAGIEDLSNNPSADTEAVIAKVAERFRLELTDEQAEKFFLGLIGDSLAALAPRVMEVFHQLAVARR